MEEGLIKTLKQQHRDIGGVLEKMEIEINSSYFDFESFRKRCEKFSEMFFIHLKLEDDVFYPKLLKLFEDTNEYSEIEVFIGQMHKIVQKVHSFLDHYLMINKKQNQDVQLLKNEFETVKTNLEIRINVEELFVYEKMLRK